MTAINDKSDDLFTDLLTEVSVPASAPPAGETNRHRSLGKLEFIAHEMANSEGLSEMEVALKHDLTERHFLGSERETLPHLFKALTTKLAADPHSRYSAMLRSGINGGA